MTTAQNVDTEKWNLRLYTAGQSPKSLAALANLKRVCDEHLAGRYSIEVVDLMKNPRLAKDDQIVAIPTLVRKLPEPLRRIVGAGAGHFLRSFLGLSCMPRGVITNSRICLECGMPRDLRT